MWIFSRMSTLTLITQRRYLSVFLHVHIKDYKEGLRARFYQTMIWANLIFLLDTLNTQYQFSFANRWKDPQNAFRTHPKFKLTSIPTLIKYNTVSICYEFGLHRELSL